MASFVLSIPSSKSMGGAKFLLVYEDNVLIREFLEEKGHGRVLVVDGGGSMRCAILGGNPVQQAQNNGWAGIVVNGCIRDVDEINGCDIGVRALNSHPMKANKKGMGEKHVPVTIAGTRICDGEWLYADTDGILVSRTELTPLDPTHPNPIFFSLPPTLVPPQVATATGANIGASLLSHHGHAQQALPTAAALRLSPFLPARCSRQYLPTADLAVRPPEHSRMYKPPPCCTPVAPKHYCSPPQHPAARRRRLDGSPARRPSCCLICLYAGRPRAVQGDGVPPACSNKTSGARLTRMAPPKKKKRAPTTTQQPPAPMHSTPAAPSAPNSGGGATMSDDQNIEDVIGIEDMDVTNEVPLEVTPLVKKKRARTGNYTAAEDEALVLAWENVSLDPITSTNQDGSTYWDRIADYYNRIVKSKSFRTTKSLQQLQTWKKKKKKMMMMIQLMKRREEEEAPLQKEKERVKKQAQGALYKEVLEKMMHNKQELETEKKRDKEEKWKELKAIEERKVAIEEERLQIKKEAEQRCLLMRVAGQANTSPRASPARSRCLPLPPLCIADVEQPPPLCVAVVEQPPPLCVAGVEQPPPLRGAGVEQPPPLSSTSPCGNPDQETPCSCSEVNILHADKVFGELCHDEEHCLAERLKSCARWLHASIGSEQAQAAVFDFSFAAVTEASSRPKHCYVALD
nr:unnamed protein product [Digitaria exilis]